MKFDKHYLVMLKKAKADIESAKVLCASNNKYIDNGIILFHLQQAVEKSIKSLLLFNNIETPRTHDIEKLIFLITSNNIDFSFNLNVIDSLTDFAVQGRYDFVDDDFKNIYFLLDTVEKLLSYIQTKVK
jgi:HEPN domain-containing protein